MLVRYTNTVTSEYIWSPFELAKFSTKILSWTFSNKNECLLLFIKKLKKRIKRELLPEKDWYSQAFLVII